MKRPSANAKIGPEVRRVKNCYAPLSESEIERRTHLRWQIKEEGVLDAHQEFVRRGGFERKDLLI